MKLLALALVGAALLGAAAAEEWKKPDFCKDKDCPRFRLEKQAEDYETRTYEPATWAYVKLEDVRTISEGIMEGFAHLFQYFNGENEGGVKIPMTAPVATNVTLRHHHHRREEEDGLWGWVEDVVGKKKKEKVDVTIKCFLPYEYQEGGGNKEAPKPKSEEVHLDKFLGWTAHVMAFDGFPAYERFMHAYEDLVDALEEEDEDYSNDWAMFSVYNAPEELEDRHNEVLLPAEGGKRKASAIRKGIA